MKAPTVPGFASFRARVPRAAAVAGAVALAFGLAACGPQSAPPPAELNTTQIHSLVRQAAPYRRIDAGWARDMRAAFTRLDLPATRQNVCAAIAVVAQESGFVADPEVPGLADISLKKLQQVSQNPAAWAVINVRLRQQAADGRTFYEQLLAIRTERDLERWYQAFMAAHMTGPLLRLAGKDVDTLISTLGSMQVSVQFARAFAREHDIPDADMRERLYSREGGLFYGIAHLLKYEYHYADIRHLFADYNAGHYASRNAGFQRMVATLSGARVVPDGDLLSYADGRGAPSATMRAVLSALARAGRPAEATAVLRDLRLEKQAALFDTATYRQIAELHRQRSGYAITEAMPQIDLQSDKIQRPLTTGWFAARVGSRYQQCLRAPM